jgi:class 3 adenylate cyclase/predicted ATPase
MDVGGWLRKLGLEQYETAFREHKIEDTVLPSLTAEDLKELGVGFVGHRRRLLDAIASLRAEGTTPTPLSDAPLVTDKAGKESAERRQVTVMFADIVGSTALSTRMDPEDLREIISAYQKTVADAVRRFDGFVAKYMGDGVLAYFGYPQAHEDDAERAVWAGLELILAVAELKTSAPLQSRVGIATGMVVVGDLIGSGDTQERGIVGETPNLAARLQAIAEPNTAVIAESTRRLLGNLFELQYLGVNNLKGMPAPVPAWVALRACSVESRFEALHPTGLTALVGRDEESELLGRRWSRAKNGEGQVVLISGEAGIGKSRLTAALLESLAGDPHTRLRYFCSPHHQDSAFYPSIAQLERAAGFRRDDTDAQRLDKLEAVLLQATDDISDAAPLMANLLSISTGDRYAPLDLTPQKRKQKTLLAQLLQVEGLATRQPLLMVFEDVHWSDPTTRESLDLLIDKVASLRVLLILTFRPDFAPPWIGRAHVTLLSLSRLLPRDRARLMLQVTGDKSLPIEIADEIIDRTDGVPLFVEELTKAVIESGVLTDAGDHYTAAAPVARLAIPTSLQASLLARLDRLAPTREVAQIAAALGRHFSHELISAVAAMPSEQLDNALAQLVQAELLLRRGTPPDAEYTFKHALVQDAAYSTLLRGRRQQLHGQIARAFEDSRFDIVATEPEVLAHHLTEAGLTEPAIKYWHRAGQHNLKRSAYVEAVKHLSRAIELLRAMPETQATLGEELEICIKMGPALMALKGAPSAEVETIYQRAVELTDQLGSTPRRFPALWGLWYVNYTRGNYAAAQQIGERLLETAQDGDDTGELLEAHHALWAILSAMGRAAEAVVHMERGVVLYDQLPQVSQPYLYGGHDPGACCRYHLTVNLWLLGYPDRSLHAIADVLRFTQELKHPLTRVIALWYVAWVYYQRGDRPSMKASLEQLVALANEHGISTLMGPSTFLLDAYMRSGSELAELADRFQETWSATNWHRVFCMCVLAERCNEDHHIEEGLAVLASINADERAVFYAPEIHRLEGELRRRLPLQDGKKIESCLRAAFMLARERGEKSLELRAAVSLALFWRDQGKRDEARGLLAPVYGWFTEGFDTRDLKEAKALLDKLRH